MADNADIAQMHELLRAEILDRRIQKLRTKLQSDRPSALYCVECEEPIPEERRKAVPGVQLCVECQSDLERRQR